jgi:hypothetical protein
MKARSVASIMRHVASRLPSFDPDAGDGSADATSDAKKDQDKEGGGGGDGGAVADEIAPPVGPSEEERLEKLYEQIAWPLGRKYGNMYDAFKLALTQVFFPPPPCSSPFSHLTLYLLPFPFGTESKMQSSERFLIPCRKQPIAS